MLWSLREIQLYTVLQNDKKLCCNVLFYFKVVLENLSRGEDYECPFARASIALTKMLCEVLEINSEPRKLCLSFTSHFFEIL